MSDKVIDIEELKQDQHNFNKGTEEGEALMDKSLTELGAGRSILIDKYGNIIAGNKTQKAAIKAGIKRVRVIETTGDELVAVKRTDVDIDSELGRKLAYADNVTQQVNLAWDETELALVSDQVAGFDLDEWDVVLPKDGAFVSDTPSAPEPEAEEDDFDEEKEEIPAVCKTGDIWLMGEHRLLCGDSTKKEDVLRLMDGEKADLWLTDPPYNVAVKNSQRMSIANDNMASSDFRVFLNAAFSAAYGVMTKGCPFYIWFASREHINFEGALNDVGLKVRQELVWNKTHFALGRAHYQWKHEPCLYGWKGGVCRYFIDARNKASVIDELNIDKMKPSEMRALLHDIYEQKVPTSVINAPAPRVDDVHPTMKPMRLFGYLMTNSSRPGDIVLDNFGGSGTTMICAEQLGRKARLIEYDPHYCDVIIARWEKMTGKKAVKQESQNQ